MNIVTALIVRFVLRLRRASFVVKISLFLTTVLIGKTVLGFIYEDGSAVYRCKPTGACARRLVYDHSEDEEFVEHPSEQLCKLTCGKYGALWPRPTVSSNIGEGTVPFRQSLVSYEFANPETEVVEFLQNSVNIFKRYLKDECGRNCSVPSHYLVIVSIGVERSDLTLNLDTDESYSLEIYTKDDVVSVQIAAVTVYGARHALETLSQLVAPYTVAHRNGAYLENGLVIVKKAYVEDRPVFKHRGLLLDTARHYLPVDVIKRQINAMAASKLNVLHWHITDSQSFPLQSPRVPQLSRYGAYGPDKVYSPEDVRHLIKYAKTRGIRIIMEIDTPSHAGNGWQWGEPTQLGSLVTCFNKQPWTAYCFQPPCGQLNPANQNIYKVLENLYKDVIDMNPNEIFHMGGDEVMFNCWGSSWEILHYMMDKGWTISDEGYLNLWAEFHWKALEAYDKQTAPEERPVILWSSRLTHPSHIEKYLDKDRFIIQTWVNAENTIPMELISKGYRLIVSTRDAWYLDHGFYLESYHVWETVYNNRIPRHDQVLGGEVCMWGEYTDESSIETKIWPRAAAAAERLWSDPEFMDPSVQARFLLHRERLVKRGIRADAVTPEWCYLNEGSCD